jgi:tryptophan synthase alpha chain
MNRINRLFNDKPSRILSIYFTAGFPELRSTADIIRSLAEAGTDMIEIGMPFSDPMADGEVIQQSNALALKNGMNLKRLFNQIKEVRKEVGIPLLLMGYLNPVMQFGFNKFCEQCAETGIDGVILPDLPMDEYLEPISAVFGSEDKGKTDPLTVREPSLKDLFEKTDLQNVFLISPQTSHERISRIDSLSAGFIYMVSSSSTTGVKNAFSAEQISYFQRIRDMKLKNPRLIGFGISNPESFSTACKYAQGAIIGSAFVRRLANASDPVKEAGRFVREIKLSN